MTSTHKAMHTRSIANPVSPSRYKTALLTWAAAFPLLTAVNVLFGPQLAALPLPVRTFLLTGMLIGLLTYVIMPRLSQWCASWLLLPGSERGEGHDGRETRLYSGQCTRSTSPGLK
jgi:antibiotic biosynthesis monooxygenase (ABM) superfamily enzyme